MRCPRLRAQLPSVLDLVQRVPEAVFIVDHMGNPNISAGLFHPWAEYITQLATHRNVYCKVSGVPDDR